MNRMTKGYVFGVFAALALAGCGGSGGGVDEPSQPDQPPVDNVGYLNLGVSDAPIRDASKVCIRFDGVELKRADSDERVTIDFDPAEVVNLLAVQGANAYPILVGEELPAGIYEWIRLKVQAERGLMGGTNDPGLTGDDCDENTENSYLVRSKSAVYNLYIPSGSQRGLQLIGDIVIPVNSTADYTAEWDLGKSFNAPPGQAPDVMMKPVVKIVSNAEVGTLVGQVADGLVDPELVDPEACDADFAPSVYVFNDGVEPNPIDYPPEEEDPDNPFEPDPEDAVATGLVQFDDELEEWRYSIGFLLAGSYEAAYTCNGTDFIPIDGKEANIVAGEVETVNFLTDDEPGTLTGQVAGELVDPDLVEPEACDAEFAPAVYVFAGDVTPSPDGDVVATAPVEEDVAAEQYRYSISLAASTYTAAFTCNGADFIPEAGKLAEIVSGEEKIIDFSADDATPSPE